MNSENRKVEAIIQLLVGQYVKYVTCDANIIDVGFDKITLHISSFGRIRNKKQILVTTNDYQSWDEINESNNDEWQNIKKYEYRIIGGRVLDAEYSSCGDLLIGLDNGIMIECFLSNGEHKYEDECEEWCLFGKDNSDEKFYLIRYSMDIELVFVGKEGN